MSIKQLCELHPHLQEYHKICSLQLLCHLSHQHFLSLPTQNTENVLQAEGRCNYPLPVKISFKVQNFHFQLSLFVDSIFYILVAKMVRYSQDIIIELQSGLEAWPERFSRPDCPHGTSCAWLTHAHDILCTYTLYKDAAGLVKFFKDASTLNCISQGVGELGDKSLIWLGWKTTTSSCSKTRILERIWSSLEYFSSSWYLGALPITFQGITRAFLDGCPRG